MLLEQISEASETAMPFVMGIEHYWGNVGGDYALLLFPRRLHLYTVLFWSRNVILFFQVFIPVFQALIAHPTIPQS